MAGSESFGKDFRPKTFLLWKIIIKKHIQTIGTGRRREHTCDCEGRRKRENSITTTTIMSIIMCKMSTIGRHIIL